MSIIQLEELATIVHNLEDINQFIKNLSTDNVIKTRINILSLIQDTKEGMNHV
jgi:hypothetical protein